MGFSRIKKPSIRDEIIDQIITAIRSGRYKAGDQLPTEAALTESMGVGRSTVREALQGLELLGVIERTTSGAFVSRDYSINAVSQYLYLGLSLDQLDPADIYQARKVLESELAARAASRISDKEIIHLESIHAEMVGLTESEHARYLELNRDFHVRICEIGVNPILLRMWKLTDDLLRKFLPESAPFTPSFKEISDQRHSKMIEALRARSPSQAREVIGQSLKISEDALRERITKV